MRTRTRIWLVSLLAILGIAAAALGSVFNTSHAQSNSPDYGKVDDFLNGGKHLLRSDGLIIGYSWNALDEPRKTLFSAGTANSVPAVSDCARLCYYDFTNQFRTALSSGRFFNTERDTVVQFPYAIYQGVPPGLISLTSNDKAELSTLSQQPLSIPASATYFVSAAADFNGDGYDDVAMNYNDPATLRIATAVDVSNSQAGFKLGPELTLNTNAGVREMTVGDFNGDGQPEIAVLYVTADTNLYLATYRVDPKTLAIANGGRVALNKLADILSHPLQLTAGRFTNAPHQQLVVGSQLAEGGNIKVQVIDFDTDSVQPKLMTTWETPDVGTGLTLKLKTGRFNWSSPYDQIAWMSATRATGTRLSILTVDPVTLATTRKADILGINDPGSRAVGSDIAIGNFDHMKTSTADPTKKERDPNLQLAVLGPRVNTSNGQSGTAFLYLYDVAPDMSQFTQTSSKYLDGSYFANNEIVDMSLAAADLQGRSMRLGAGYKITVDRAAPSMVLAAPPMHADYANPASGKTPTVLNLSVAPDGFHSEYEQSDSSDNKGSSKSTTSSSFAGEESVSGSLTLGETNPASGELENGVKITDTFTAKQDIETSAENSYGTFNSFEFEISQETGLSDVVWLKDTSYYLYVYPVIGRKVCPADKPNCQESEKNPLQVMFSAPKDASVQRLAADTLEWYQPPWEYGNLFSYPAGLAQLRQYFPDLALLTLEEDIFATDDANVTLKTTWINGKTTGQSIEHKELFTEENDLSIEGKLTVPGVSGTIGLDLNFGGSNGTQSLTEYESQMKSATGITIQKKAGFAEPFFYKYFFSPYIFGKAQPLGLTDPFLSVADLTTYGALRSAYTADPLANGAGGWWKQAYGQFPDVAVNHPNRWSLSSTSKPSTGILPSNCVGLDASNMSCVKPAEREPENPWLDPFHDMRGLFITNAATPGVGPQQQIVTAGVKLSLQTRVYNYSFKAMPAGTKVKVRFYGMEWDVATNRPAKQEGESFLIGETALSPIAPFDNSRNAPLNWVLAGTTFDTTGYVNKDLIFWVAVWMEDASGKLVQETAGHGLTSVPENVAKPTFEDFTKLEEMVANPLKSSPDDPEMVSFSNNIGFYRLAIHVQAKTSAAAQTLAAASAANNPAEIKVEKVEVGAASLKPGQSVEISAMLRAGAQSLQGVSVYFYDGDPGAGGRLFDLERLAHIRAGGQHKVSVLFDPEDCGSHRIFIKVAPGREHAATGQASQAIQVECPAPICVAQVCLRSAQYYALNSNRLPKGTVAVAGNGLDTRVSTSDTGRMRLLLAGGASAQQKLNQQFVTAQLNLLAKGGFNQAALRSNLLCYQLNFQPTRLGTGATLNPSMTLGELFDQALQAGRSGKAIDQRLIANLLELLNGDDPQGRCGR